MSTERFNMIIRDYPEQMKLSDKKNTIYYHESEGNRLPQYIRESLSIGYHNPTFRYYSDPVGWIRDTNTHEKVIQNKQTAGKPNMQTINGQGIWDGSVSRITRNNLKKFLTEFFAPQVTRCLPRELFTPAGEYFHFEFIFYLPIIERKFRVLDIDNHAYPYVKAFTDTLVTMKVITDDNAQYYRGYYPRYVNCKDESEKRLEIKVHFCKNDERIT